MEINVFHAILCVVFINRFTSVQSDYDHCVTSDRQTGKCTDLISCGPTYELLTKGSRPMSANMRKKLKEDHCGFNGLMPKVCCPAATVNSYGETVTPYSLPTPISPPPNVTAHPNFNLLPKTCGQNDENKIIGGRRTGIFEYTWMALIAHYFNGETSYGCGGTIISMDYILTAAHCLTNLGQGKTVVGVRVGEHNLNTDQDCEGSAKRRYCAPPVQDFLIKESFFHESYNRVSRQNDIGIIRLLNSIDFSRYNTQPICLPTLPELANKNLNSETMIIAGWGVTENNFTSDELLAASVAVVENTRCSAIYSSSTIEIFHKQICAGGEAGVDSCNGDSGGPLMLLDRVGSTLAYIQHGIVSAGPDKCGSLGKPGVYTRVGYYMDWILDKMRPTTEEDYED